MALRFSQPLLQGSLTSKSWLWSKVEAWNFTENKLFKLANSMKTDIIFAGLNLNTRDKCTLYGYFKNKGNLRFICWDSVVVFSPNENSGYAPGFKAYAWNFTKTKCLKLINSVKVYFYKVSRNSSDNRRRWPQPPTSVSRYPWLFICRLKNRISTTVQERNARHLHVLCTML